jgi:hypothetical protein
LSEDHSVAEEWVRMGRLTPEEAAVHPRRHQLTRGVGVEDTIAIDVTSINALPGDRILLCSDGLSNELDADTLARLASAPNGLEFAVESLVSAAKVAGGHDNISVILLEFDEVNVAATPIRRTMSSAPPARDRDVATHELRSPPKNCDLARLGGHVSLSRGRRRGGRGHPLVRVFDVLPAGDHDGMVAVFRGQPSGVLWYKPEVVVETNFPVADLRIQDRRASQRHHQRAHRKEAVTYAKNIYRYEWELGQTTTTTTTTTKPG